MSLLYKLLDERVWIDFYQKKTDPAYCRTDDALKLFKYVREKRYLPVVERILNGIGLSVPQKKRIAKSDTAKKRIVYSLPEDEAMVLKLLTWLMIRKYDWSLQGSLYSFRPNYGTRDALNKLTSMADISQYYSYKLDVRNYFNSIDVALLLPELEMLFSDDVLLYEFIASQLSDSRAVENGKIVEEPKGVMAGMPYAVFFANVFLSRLDREFEMIPQVVYCRYSDDIIIFSKDKDILDAAKARLLNALAEFHLEVNPSKVSETVPGEPWTFLGFECNGREVDVCRISIEKLKAKMRRKSRELEKWKRAGGKEGWMAARAFIKHFNRKLYTSESSCEINWSWWYFPLITTDKSLKVIDSYMQDCVRFIATGRRTKSRYNFSYAQMKELGLQSLVNRWYLFKSN